MADQARMPYTNAVIHEVQRFGDIIPLNIPRITSRDIEVQDFLIPKNQSVHRLQPSRVLTEEKYQMKMAKGHFMEH